MMSNNKLYMIIISDFKIQREAFVVKKLCKLEVLIRNAYLKTKFREEEFQTTQTLFRIRFLRIMNINHRTHFSP